LAGLPLADGTVVASLASHLQQPVA